VSGVALCTDASSLLSPTAAAELGVEVVPVPVALDGEPFEGPVDAFYERLRAGAVATTSQPSPGDFLEAYQRAAGNGSASVLSLHLDGRISGVGASAALAASEAPVPVRVVALPTVSYGVALCVRVAHAALAGGATETNAVSDATRIAATLDNVFVARAVDSGRVSASASWTLLRFTDGVAQPLSSHESLDEASSAMRRHITEPALPGLVAVGHAGPELEVAADRLAHELVHESVAAVERYRVGPSVGAHTGPDCFGAFWWPAEL
jgi:DegV family protein with EDD domain